MRADGRPATLLACDLPPTMRAEGRPAALLACDLLPTMRADGRPAALLALLLLPAVRAAHPLWDGQDRVHAAACYVLYERVTARIIPRPGWPPAVLRIIRIVLY